MGIQRQGYRWTRILYTVHGLSTEAPDRYGIVLIEAAMGRIFEVTEKNDVVWEFVVSQLSDYEGLIDTGPERAGTDGVQVRR